MKTRITKEWCLRMAASEPDCPITAGVPDECDALWQIQQLAAVGIEQTNDTGPLADLFAEIHRTAASMLASPQAPTNTATELVKE
jgi:hypothetical protein